MNSTYETMGGKYQQNGDYLLPMSCEALIVKKCCFRLYCQKDSSIILNNECMAFLYQPGQT